MLKTVCTRTQTTTTMVSRGTRTPPSPSRVWMRNPSLSPPSRPFFSPLLLATADTLCNRADDGKGGKGGKTSERRRAQNRAAQRAFRERKEKVRRLVRRTRQRAAWTPNADQFHGLCTFKHYSTSKSWRIECSRSNNRARSSRPRMKH